MLRATTHILKGLKSKNKKQNLRISSVGEKKQLECFTICETGKAAVTPDKGLGLP